MNRNLAPADAGCRRSDEEDDRCESSPWDDIVMVPGSSRCPPVAVGTAVPCFWGRDCRWRLPFIVGATGRNGPVPEGQERSPERHIDADLCRSGQRHLVLALERQVDRDLFEGLCPHPCIPRWSIATDSAGSLAVSGAHTPLEDLPVGPESAPVHRGSPGLFAEIVFLTELIDPADVEQCRRRCPRSGTITSGFHIRQLQPSRSKSLSGAERSNIRISSEDQLESLNDALFLRVYRLSNLADAAGARFSMRSSLHFLQARRRADAVEALTGKLVAHGCAAPRLR